MPYDDVDEQSTSDRAAAVAVVAAAITNAIASEPAMRVTAGDYSWGIPRLGVGMGAQQLAGYVVDALRTRRWLATPSRCGVYAGWGAAAGVALGFMLAHTLMTHGLAAIVPAAITVVLAPAAVAAVARRVALRRQQQR